MGELYRVGVMVVTDLLVNCVLGLLEVEVGRPF